MFFKPLEMTPEQQKQRDELNALLKKAADVYAAMSPAEKEEMFKAQRESMARSALPLGHDKPLAWCEAELIKVEKKIADATGWGAHLTALDECVRELRISIAQKKRLLQQENLSPTAS